MRFEQSMFFFLTLILIWSSCSEFCEGECPEELEYPLRILDSQDSTDLIFGENSVYKFEDMRMFSLQDSDSTFYSMEMRPYSTQTEGVLRVDHGNFTASQVFLDFGNSDLDTLNITFTTADCCGSSFRFLQSVDHNGHTVYQSGDGSIVVEIFK